MRALTYVDPGVVRWQEVPEPALPGPGGALVRPLAVARCDLDRPMAASGVFPGPFPVGHEFVAEVVEVAPGVGRVRAGDRVLVPFQVSCGTCGPCRSGRTPACATYRARAGAAYGFGEAGGGFGGAVADLVAVPAADHMLLPAPPGVPAEVLCTLPDNVVDAYRAVGPQLLADPGAGVLVLAGAAPSIGLYAVAVARAMGAGRVRYVDRDGERCAAAQRLGAEVTRQEGPWPRRFERALVVVDATAGGRSRGPAGPDDAQGLACALRSTDDYGTCTRVAISFAPEVPVPLLEMYTRGVTLLTARADSRRHLPAVLDLVAAGRLAPADVPTRVHPWDAAERAWLAPATKLVLTRG